MLVKQVADYIDIRISDRGVGLTTPTTNPGLGLGLKLMSAEADHCEIQTSPTEGTQITLRFARAGSAG